MIDFFWNKYNEEKKNRKLKFINQIDSLSPMDVSYLSEIQLKLLRELTINGIVSITDLSTYYDRDKSTISRHVAAIKEKYIRNGILYFKPDLNQSFNSFKLISGTITVTDGPSSGSSDEFYITIKGKGGHASAPHRSVDPIFIAAQVYIGIQGFLNRTVDPIAPIIFTIGKIEGGSRHNIISETCYMEGTLRTLDEDLRDHLIDEIPKKIKEFALIYGGDAEIDIRRGYAVGYNDKEINDHVRKAVIDLYGEDSLYVNNTPILGSEDFYEFRLRGKIPISMFGLGGRNEAKGFISSNHSNYFDFDEDALPIGVAVLTQTALNYLSS